MLVGIVAIVLVRLSSHTKVKNNEMELHALNPGIVHITRGQLSLGLMSQMTESGTHTTRRLCGACWSAHMYGGAGISGCAYWELYTTTGEQAIAYPCKLNCLFSASCLHNGVMCCGTYTESEYVLW